MKLVQNLPNEKKDLKPQVYRCVGPKRVIKTKGQRFKRQIKSNGLPFSIAPSNTNSLNQNFWGEQQVSSIMFYWVMTLLKLT